MNSLPYNLPKDTKSQLEKLASITSIPRNLLVGAGEIEVQAIAAMILYRHMDRLQRIEALALIRSISNKALLGAVLEKALDTTFVNSQWGIWSLSNEELLSDISFHESIDSFVGYVGIGASIVSGKDIVKDIWSLKKVGKKHWTLIIIWGCIVFNKTELQKAKSELNNRQTLNQSGLY